MDVVGGGIDLVDEDVDRDEAVGFDRSLAVQERGNDFATASVRAYSSWGSRGRTSMTTTRKMRDEPGESTCSDSGSDNDAPWWNATRMGRGWRRYRKTRGATED